MFPVVFNVHFDTLILQYIRSEAKIWPTLMAALFGHEERIPLQIAFSRGLLKLNRISFDRAAFEEEDY